MSPTPGISHTHYEGQGDGQLPLACCDQLPPLPTVFCCFGCPASILQQEEADRLPGQLHLLVPSGLSSCT
eukprot:10435062-Prorocentrum_lima.AAC.1